MSDMRPAGARPEHAGEDWPRPRRDGGRAVAVLLYGGTALAALAGPRLARRFGRRMPSATADALAALSLIGTGWAGLALAERSRPFRREWNGPHGDLATDLPTMVVTVAISQAVGAVVTAPLRRRLGPRTAEKAMSRLPLVARVAVAVIVDDLAHSAFHRASHETALWRFHAVHHSSRRLYWFNATRFHPVEMLVDITADQVISVALGLDGPTLLSYQVLRGIYGQIQHANVDLDSGPLNAVLSTPERHRWHHSTDPAEGNTNYGAVVCVWDRLLGTAFLPTDRPFDAEIGLNDQPDFPQDWVGQLAAPFRG